MCFISSLTITTQRARRSLLFSLFVPNLQSHAPTAPASLDDGTRFWLDGHVEIALNVLIVERKYSGRLLPDSGSTEQNNEGDICVEEMTPANLKVLPHYIASLPSYTEKQCRKLCRQMAEIIKLSHDNGMAHRNIHMNNWLVDKRVRSHNLEQPIIEFVSRRCPCTQQLFLRIKSFTH